MKWYERSIDRVSARHRHRSGSDSRRARPDRASHPPHTRAEQRVTGCRSGSDIVFQVRKSAANRRVQGARRMQRRSFPLRCTSRSRRRYPFLGQSRRSIGVGRQATRHSCVDRHAGECGRRQARCRSSLWRHDTILRADGHRAGTDLRCGPGGGFPPPHPDPLPPRGGEGERQPNHH